MTFHPAKAMDTIQRIIAFADIGRAFKALKVPMPHTKIEISIHRRIDVEKVDDKIIGLLQRLFPVDEDMMLSSQMEGDSMFDDMDHCLIIPEFCGFSTSWDEIAEAMDEGPQYSEVMSVPIFIGAYMNEFDEEAWGKFNEHFGWGVDYPDPHEDYIVELGKLYKKIERSKKIKFDRSYIEAILEDSGLAFFDNNPYSEDSYANEYFPWSYKSIMKLAVQWKKAKVICDRIPYNTKVGRDPEQLKLLLKAIKECEIERSSL